VGAIEQLARIVTASPKAKLGECITTLRKTGRVQPPLLRSIEELWGWTSGEPGVPHGAGAIMPAEALYVLDDGGGRPAPLALDRCPRSGVAMGPLV
jgi:hypothetical protein